MKYICFTGQSGAGKGTHATLLRGYLESRGKHVCHIENGELVRTAAKHSTFADAIASVDARGIRQPVVFMVHLWLQALEECLTEDTIVIQDGSPRSVTEVEYMHELVAAGYIPKPLVFVLDAKRVVCEARLFNRTREDKRKSLSVPGSPGTPDLDVIRQKLQWWENERDTIVARMHQADMDIRTLTTTTDDKKIIHQYIIDALEALPH